MFKKMICLILSLTLLLSLAGCGNGEPKEGEYQVYYTNMDRTKLVTEDYDSTGAQGEELVLELLEELKSAPDSFSSRTSSIA